MIALLLASLLAWGAGPEPGAPWREVRYRGHTSYRVVADSSGVRLLASSRAANSALFHPAPPGEPPGEIAWRWRVLRHPEGADTRRRSGDDRAAAVFVLVRRGWWPGATQGLLYQWSTDGTDETWRRSPYAAGVHVITLRRGPAGHAWYDERRDLAADLRAAFGTAPRRIEAVGVLCDTDDTKSEASAEFAGIEWRDAPAR